MRSRVEFNGPGDTGPIWVWTDSVVAVWSRKGMTMIALVGCEEPGAVTESVAEVLEAIDTAESTAAASAAGLLA